MHGFSRMQAPAGWEDAERAERLAARIPAETGLPAQDLLSLCAQSADPDGALAGSLPALAARKARYGRPAPRAALAPLVRICSASKFLAQALAARPRLVDLLACPGFAHRPTPLRTQECADEVALARR